MAIQLYENIVLENKMTDLVNTKLDANSLFTIDDSLTNQDGMTKVIHKYTYEGEVEKLAKGAKNTTRGAVSMVRNEYRVERYQQVFDYNDEDVMEDSYVLDVLTEGAATKMANHIKSQYFAELAKISKTYTATTFNYNAVVDALAAINQEVESDMFIVMGLDMRAAIRKDEDFKSAHQGEIVYTGQFGTIAGVPCLFSKLVPEKTVYITTKDAVRLFVKKDGSVEQDREMESNTNTIKYERYGLMALVDETESIKITVTGA